jgi:hypothetical protein
LALAFPPRGGKLDTLILAGNRGECKKRDTVQLTVPLHFYFRRRQIAGILCVFQALTTKLQAKKTSLIAQVILEQFLSEGSPGKARKTTGFFGTEFLRMTRTE